MEREIRVGGQNISYTMRRNRRAKRMLLSVYAGGRVVVTTPYALNIRSAERLLREKAGWLLAALQKLKDAPQPKAAGNRQEYLRLREQARAHVCARLRELNEHYGFEWQRISIRNQKTCWGSCSAKKNLNFNYKILHLPEHLRDYVLVHELCHLKELNHSPRFWRLVERTLPDYKRYRRELRTFDVHGTKLYS